MLLAVDHLAKAYGDNQVLSDVTFTMHPGDKWGLVGRTASASPLWSRSSPANWSRMPAACRSARA